jgi:hypothetical protein
MRIVLKYAPPTLLLIVVTISSCNKSCDEVPTACSEVPPPNELCQAYFERWFYTGKGKKCEKKSYSGCASYGFDTKDACEECSCRQ